MTDQIESLLKQGEEHIKKARELTRQALEGVEKMPGDIEINDTDEELDKNFLPVQEHSDKFNKNKKGAKHGEETPK